MYLIIYPYTNAYISFISFYNWINIEYTDGEEVLEISYKIFLQRDRPQRRTGQGRRVSVSVTGLTNVLVLSLFFMIYPWAVSSISVTAIPVHGRLTSRSSYSAQFSFLNSKFMYLTVHWTSPLSSSNTTGSKLNVTFSTLASSSPPSSPSPHLSWRAAHSVSSLLAYTYAVRSFVFIKKKICLFLSLSPLSLSLTFVLVILLQLLSPHINQKRIFLK